MGNFWNGDVRLVKAYWIYGLLLPNGAVLLLWLSGVRLVPGSAIAILFGIVMLVYMVFWGVGTWRSASKYTGPKIWAILTKAQLALPLVGLILAIAIPALETPRARPEQSKRDDLSAALPNVTRESMFPRLGPPPPDGDLRERSQAPVTLPPKKAEKDIIEPNGDMQTVTTPETPTNSTTGQSTGVSLQDFRQKLPQLSGLSDADALDILHKNYYPTVDKQRMADALGIKLPPSKPKLGWLDQSRYESCQQDAAKAPTPHGVNVGLRICREKFNQ